MINDPKEIKEVLNAIDKIKKEDLDKTIEEVDNKLSEEEIIEECKKLSHILDLNIKSHKTKETNAIHRFTRPIPKGKRKE